MAHFVDRDQVRELGAHGVQLVEVLPAKEFAEDHLPGAMSLPLRRIDRDSVQALDRGRPLIVYCWDVN